MASPLYMRFADGSARCMDCKGYGLVRARGARAGEHYKTLNGAQTAYRHGNARDCVFCEGSGLVNLPGIREAIKSFGVDREAVNDDKVRVGVRVAAMSAPGDETSYLVRARTPGVFDRTPAVF